jgi:hypothetical protein
VGEAPSVESRQRTGFRQEPDRLILANRLFATGLSTVANGTIVSLYHRNSHTEFVNSDEAVAEGLLWRAGVVTREGGRGVITNRTCREFTHRATAEKDGSLRLRLEWKGLRVGASPVEGEAVAEWLVSKGSATALVALQVRLPEQVSVESLEFPIVCALGSTDARLSESLFLPLSGGLLIPNVRGLLEVGGERGWRADYPGAASMQLLGCSFGAQASVALACHDRSGSQKSLVAGGMAHSNRLVLSAVGTPVKSQQGAWGLGYAMGLSVVEGGWAEAAREYRVWAVEQPWCSRGKGGLRNIPEKTAAQGLWASFWGGPRAVATVMRELQRMVSIPLKLDWRCWHGCAREGQYPDYLPPRDGEQSAVTAINQIREGGMLAQIGVNGLLASTDSRAWREEAAGEYSLGEEAGGGKPEEGDGGRRAVMCPSTKYWRGKLVSLLRQAAAYGANGFYVEGLVGAEARTCGNPAHAHAPADRTQWAQAVRGLLAELREALPPEVHLATDGPAEQWVDLADVMFTPHAAAERLGWPESPGAQRGEGGYGQLWSVIPLFSAVYHSYCTLVSSGTSLINSHPFDPMWTAETIAELHEPEDLIGRDFGRQFYLEAARAMVWGEQPMVSNVNLRQVRDERCRRRMAFMTAALRAHKWGVGMLLPFSDLVGLLDIEASPIDVEMLVNPPGSKPEERGTTRRSVVPVLGSAWQTPGSGVALLLANIHEQPVEFSTTLKLGRSGPVDIAGRTFSEDGEVSSAKLQTSGDELTGRMPAHAVFLVSIR